MLLHRTHEHKPEDMVLLCPTHAHRADTGELSEATIRQHKKAPHNQHTVGYEFEWRSRVLPL